MGDTMLTFMFRAVGVIVVCVILSRAELYIVVKKKID